MEQDIRRPDYTPRKHDRSASTLSCLISAVGATMMTLTLIGAAAAATVWAFGKLLGFPALVNNIVLGLVMIPVLIATAWMAGRAWHVERMMARGGDVDVPVFKLMHYFRQGR